MTRPLAAIIVAASIAAAANAQAPPPTFRARADLVSLDVAVRQRLRPVTGLTAADFQIVDNGVPQQVANLTYGDVPIDLTVALDSSESVKGSLLDRLRQSVRELAGDLTPRDRLRLVSFNVQISQLMDFGEPLTGIDRAFGRIQPAGSTALRDTIAVALATAPSPERRQLVVVFSDGEDQSSVTSPDTLIAVARRTSPALGLVVASARSDALERASRSYGALIKETGGFIEIARPETSLGSAFRRILTDFRRSYVLYFVPTGVARGGYHAVEVKVNRPGVEVRARPGYASR